MKDNSKDDINLHEFKIWWEKHGDKIQNIITWTFNAITIYLIYLHFKGQSVFVKTVEVCMGLIT